MIVLITINLILTALVAIGIVVTIRRLMSQETELQDVQNLLTQTVAPGVTEILQRLNSVSVPSDNPALQDEIDGIKATAQSMADEINAALNPQSAEEGGSGDIAA